VALAKQGLLRFWPRVSVFCQEFCLWGPNDNHAFFSTAQGRNCNSRRMPNTTEVSRQVCENLKFTLVMAGGLNPWASYAPCVAESPCIRSAYSCLLYVPIYVHRPLLNAEGMILKKEVNTKTVCGRGS